MEIKRIPDINIKCFCILISSLFLWASCSHKERRKKTDDREFSLKKNDSILPVSSDLVSPNLFLDNVKFEEWKGKSLDPQDIEISIQKIREQYQSIEKNKKKFKPYKLIYRGSELFWNLDHLDEDSFFLLDASLLEGDFASLYYEEHFSFVNLCSIDGVKRGDLFPAPYLFYFDMEGDLRLVHCFTGDIDGITSNQSFWYFQKGEVYPFFIYNKSYHWPFNGDRTDDEFRLYIDNDLDENGHPVLVRCIQKHSLSNSEESSKINLAKNENMSIDGIMEVLKNFKNENLIKLSQTDKVQKDVDMNKHKGEDLFIGDDKFADILGDRGFEVVDRKMYEDEEACEWDYSLVLRNCSEENIIRLMVEMIYVPDSNFTEEKVLSALDSAKKRGVSDYFRKYHSSGSLSAKFNEVDGSLSHLAPMFIYEAQYYDVSFKKICENTWQLRDVGVCH